MTWMTLAQCDRCLKTTTETCAERWVAADRLRARGWISEDDTHFCPRCQEEVKAA